MSLSPRYRVVGHLVCESYNNLFLCEDFNQSNQVVVVKEIDLVQALKQPQTPMCHSREGPHQVKAIANFLQQSGGHPNVVCCFDSFIRCDKLYLVMERCADGDLYGYVDGLPDRRVQVPEAMAIFRQIASGLAFLHDNRIALRDLSLENILRHGSTYRITDFGLATRSLATSPTLLQGRVGKPIYMAPEVISDDLYDANAADVWSLGILLFVLLTGSPLVPVAAKDDPTFIAFQKLGVREVLDQWGLLDAIHLSVVGLLEEMLCVEPTRRLTVHQVLCHKRVEGGN